MRVQGPGLLTPAADPAARRRRYACTWQSPPPGAACARNLVRTRRPTALPAGRARRNECLPSPGSFACSASAGQCTHVGGSSAAPASPQTHGWRQQPWTHCRPSILGRHSRARHPSGQLDRRRMSTEPPCPPPAATRGWMCIRLSRDLGFPATGLEPKTRERRARGAGYRVQGTGYRLQGMGRPPRHGAPTKDA